MCGFSIFPLIAKSGKLYPGNRVTEWVDIVLGGVRLKLALRDLVKWGGKEIFLKQSVDFGTRQEAVLDNELIDRFVEKPANRKIFPFTDMWVSAMLNAVDEDDDAHPCPCGQMFRKITKCQRKKRFFF